jgi:hydrogenase maturation protein HypF
MMFPDLTQIKTVCELSEFEERLLQSPESPILLLKRVPIKQVEGEIPFQEAAPGNPNLGIMLPYTPLHHLLLHYLGTPIIATSGNLSEEPMVIDEHEAVQRLTDIADYYLVHNRPIVRQVDDSIVRVILGRELVLRRARGYAPLPVQVPVNKNADHLLSEPLLAVGAHLKNTVALQKGDHIFVSQHIGDLSSSESLQAFQKVITDFRQLYDAKPETVISDLHPDYLSTQYANCNYPLVHATQHHEAHIASCRLENQLTGTSLGVSWDGTGLGWDNSIWGGEFFISDDFSFIHEAQFCKFPLPGGDQAIREPRRSALGILYQIYGEKLSLFEHWLLNSFNSSELSLLMQMLKKRLNCPLTSSVGRLFDAVAALLNLRQQINYEGQAAMMLEYLADPSETGSYEFELIPGKVILINWIPIFKQILKQIKDKEKPSVISMRFHSTLVRIILEVARTLQIDKVVLSGGCFQNAILLEKSVSLLQENGFRPYWHQRIPPNDGGIALGQIALGWQRRRLQNLRSSSNLMETEKIKQVKEK